MALEIGGAHPEAKTSGFAWFQAQTKTCEEHERYEYNH
jgi:hypothetical protein